MSLPILNLLRGLPTDMRELARVFSDLNLSIVKSRTRVHAANHRFLNQISRSNKQSTQNIQPLSSNDLGGGFAEVVIAAHSVTDGDGTVSYNAGSITGLPNSTLVYVFADDPDSEGGAVVYDYTTNFNLITSVNGRYYVGKITTDAPAGGGTSGGWGGGGGGGGNPLP